MSRQRRRFDAAEKVKIIREHLFDKRPLSEVCEQYGIAQTHKITRWLESPYRGHL